jgi:hypothetical protein
MVAIVSKKKTFCPSLTNISPFPTWLSPNINGLHSDHSSQEFVTRRVLLKRLSDIYTNIVDFSAIKQEFATLLDLIIIL